MISTDVRDRNMMLGDRRGARGHSFNNGGDKASTTAAGHQRSKGETGWHAACTCMGLQAQSYSRRKHVCEAHRSGIAGCVQLCA
jgi:hypothetical protein